jgi:endonuclease/exonuclease/phosphatase (EEP) superfamily protein YafD
MFITKHLPLIFVLLSLSFSCSNLESQRSPSSFEKNMEFTAEFSFLIWNSYKGSRDHFFSDLATLVQSYELVLLQEAQDNSKFHSILKNNDLHNMSFGHSWGQNGVLTASRSNITQSIPLKTNVREVFFTTPKSALITTHPLRDNQGHLQTLLVINIHMINFRETNAVKVQLEQYREYIEAHQGPIIAGGDFNTWSDYRRETVEDFFTQLGLEEIKFKDKDGHDPRSKRIVGVLDRVFQRGFEVIDTKVYEEITSSDHYPFAATLSLLILED